MKNVFVFPLLGVLALLPFLTMTSQADDKKKKTSNIVLAHQG